MTRISWLPALFLGFLPIRSDTYADIHDTAPLAQFLAGQAVRAQEFLGSHPTVRGGQSGWLFRVWAPHAQAVAVMGDFNGWDDRANPMAALEGGVWSSSSPACSSMTTINTPCTPLGQGPGQGRPLCLPCRDPPRHRLQAVRSVRLPVGRRELAGLPEEQPGLPEAHEHL